MRHAGRRAADWIGLATATLLLVGCTAGNGAQPGLADPVPAPSAQAVTCRLDEPIERLMACDTIAAGTGYVTRVGAGLDEPTPAQPRAVLMDLGGPGQPWDRSSMLSLFQPLRSAGTDVYLYRERWTVEDPSPRCMSAGRRIVGPLLDGVPLRAFASSFRACLGAQQTIPEYVDTVRGVVERLGRGYRDVEVVGFSFGATRLRHALPVAPTPDVTVQFVEPGPHPSTPFSDWADRRTAAALGIAAGRCSTGEAMACALTVDGADGRGPRTDQALGALYLASQPQVTGRSVDTLARLALSINADDQMLPQGIGFIAGLCRQVDTRRPGGSVYATLVELCPSGSTVPGLTSGTASTCIVVNPEDPLVGAMAGWRDDRSTRSYDEVTPGPGLHGALFRDRVAQQRLGCGS